MQRSAGAEPASQGSRAGCFSGQRRGASSTRRAAAGGSRQGQGGYNKLARFPIPNGAPTAAEDQSTSSELSAPMPDCAGQEGLSRRPCASCRARARATRGCAPTATPPNRGARVAGRCRAASGSTPRATTTRSTGWRRPIGDLPRAPLECHGALVRGQGERARDATGASQWEGQPIGPLRLWA